MTDALPRRILLATDLSCRCDRALDRAVQLSEQWSAELIAATVIEPGPADFLEQRPASWRRQASPVERMHWRLARDVASVADNIRVVVETGDPAAKLIEIAARENCDLIVTGIARDETLGRMILGTTASRLVRGAAIPVLVVRDRPAASYRRIVVATDFSEAALQATLAAAAFFPAAALTLFHGYDIPYAGYLADRDLAPESHAMAQQARARLRREDRIGETLLERLNIIVEQGAPETLISNHVEDNHVDLTVVGSRGHGLLFETFIGSMDRRLFDTLEGDLLIVPGAAEAS
ncbi:Nucleotide-binding universal stress protein, UspA family [Sphingobium faniae]|nr:Nucleotide-binding universal stress protein, UspA family [Sphingobium faniae]